MKASTMRQLMDAKELDAIADRFFPTDTKVADRPVSSVIRECARVIREDANRKDPE